MPLDAGRRLGAFEILEPVGAGGMGEVYRAKDTRLDRIVALKVLPSALADNAALRERLAREARAISGLTHPHICTLYDVGREEGIDYLVMEYLEGETLAERLRKGPLPLEQSLRCGIEIAEALDAAHRRGVVHRDLKPGNVMLTKAGSRLLDFGLARLMETGEPPSDASASSLTTQGQPLTEKGTLLGTYPYMAPEQAEGKETDGRADIFAFGAMLHEMVTGRRAFDGESRASLIAAILEREPPPVSTLQPLSPPGLDHVVTTCLAKDPDDRWQSARDVASELRWIQEAGSQAGTPAPVVRRRKTRERAGWILAALLLAAAAAAGTWAWKDASQPTPPIVRSTILPPEGRRFVSDRGAPVLSPDGTRIAFLAPGDDGTRRLWVRSLGALDAQPLEGTEDAVFPFWSPDGESLGFFSAGKLRTIEAAGGTPRALCDAPEGWGGTWGPDDTILFSPSIMGAIYRVPASGGTPVPITVLDESRSELGHRHPHFLPGGRHFIFLVQSWDDTPGTQDVAIFGAALGSPQKKHIVATRSSARYAPSGHLLFVSDRVLFAQAFDPDRLELSGDAVPVADRVEHRWRLEAVFSVSTRDQLLYRPGPPSEKVRLVWLDRKGREQSTVGEPADYTQPRLSHDQKRIAVSIGQPENGQHDIWLLDLERGTTTRLTFDPAHDYGPMWSTDDRTIYFSSDRSGRGDVYAKSSSGSGVARLVYGGDYGEAFTSLSPDGRTGWLHSFRTTAEGYFWDIHTVDLETLAASPFQQTPSSKRSPALSPDGHWVLYQTKESGRYELYVQSLLDDGGRWQISSDGGSQGRWTRGGREIVFEAPDGTLMAVELTLEPAFSAGIPEPLFDPRTREAPLRQWDVTPDGERFLVIRAAEEDYDEPLTLVQNWTSELE